MIRLSKKILLLRDTLKQIIHKHPVMKVFDPYKTEKRQLLVWICWASVLISLVSVCISLFMSIGLPIVHLSLTALVIFMLLAIIIKRGLGITFSEFLWAGVTLFFVNVLWYHNYGHNGPALFMFLVLFSIIIFNLDLIFLVLFVK